MLSKTLIIMSCDNLALAHQSASIKFFFFNHAILQSRSYGCDEEKMVIWLAKLCPKLN